MKMNLAIMIDKRLENHLALTMDIVTRELEIACIKNIQLLVRHHLLGLRFPGHQLNFFVYP